MSGNYQTGLKALNFIYLLVTFFVQTKTFITSTYSQI